MPLKRLRATEFFGGDELRIAVEEVGTGVGNDSFPSNVFRDLFSDFGNAGDDVKGSNAGRRDAADFFLSTLPGTASCRAAGRSISLSCGSCVM